MIGKVFASLHAAVSVRIGHDRLTVHRADKRQTAYAIAPFSCDHSLVSDVDILEHAMSRALKELGLGGLLSFSTVTVSIATEGNPLHGQGGKVITDAFKNAGAREVLFDSSVVDCDDRRAEREAYVAAHTEKR